MCLWLLFPPREGRAEGSETAQEGRWELVWAEDFEKGKPGEAVGAPWVQSHPRRLIVLTDQAALSGQQSAMYRYEVSAEGSLDEEAGLFFMEASIPRPQDDPLATWRVSAALRFHPEAWTASCFRLRGEHWKASVSLVNSMNLFFLGGHLNIPVWNVAEPDRWYRVQVVLREEQGVFDLEIGEEGGDYRNAFYSRPVPPETLPFRRVGFGYVGALVRYGQGRESFLDDIRVERWVGEK